MTIICCSITTWDFHCILIYCSDPDQVILFDKKRPVTRSQSTTVYTNANSPVQVDKKVWQIAYTSSLVDIPSTAQVPKTDPEVSQMFRGNY